MRMRERGGIKAGSNVLDIATGVGDPAIYAAKIIRPSGQVLAIDLSPQRLAVAKRRAKNEGLDKVIQFEVADIEQFEFDDLKFDRILSRWE